jgi:hypothetical protein
METILESLDFGCRVITKERIPDILRVFDWFCKVYRAAGPIAQGSADEAMLEDIAKMCKLIEKGDLPPFDMTKFPGYAYGKDVGLRSNKERGGNEFIYEGYFYIFDCISRRFIPLMPYDIKGNRNIFLQRSIGRFDPLDPPKYLRKLEYINPLKGSDQSSLPDSKIISRDQESIPLSKEEHEKSKEWASKVFERVSKNNPLPL